MRGDVHTNTVESAFSLFERSIDIFAVSDGEVLFRLKLTNLDEHYASNVGTFEKSMSTLRVVAAPPANE